MPLGISAYTSAYPKPSPAAPRDANGSRLSRNTAGTTRDDPAGPRRAEKRARVEQAQAKADQTMRKVFNIQSAEEKAQQAMQGRRIDTYA